MVKELIRVNSVEPVTFKSGKSGWRFNKRFNIFEKPLADDLIAGFGNTYEFNIETSKDGKHENIRVMGELVRQDSAIIVNEQPRLPRANQGVMNEVVTEVVTEQEVILKKEKPNSRTFGKGNDQVKLYFSDADDLRTQIIQLEELRLMPKDFRETEQKPVEKKIEEAWASKKENQTLE